MTRALLEVNDLRTTFDTPEGTVRAVDGISFSIARGETLALLGESGCGKSVSAMSLLQLVPEPAGRIAGGEVWLDGQDLLALPERDMRRWRGRRIATIFQEPQTSLNAVFTIGDQIREVLSRDLSRSDANARVVQLLRDVGIPDPERRAQEFPHQLSGGMKQRAMIAMALASEPDVLIADEPTTALDVTIQAQILDLLKALQRQRGMAVLLITHDLGIVARMADRVAVMYAGEIVEAATRSDFFSRPQHPYSQKLFRSLPGRMKRGAELDVIRGSVPSLTREFRECRFADRCDFAWALCRERIPRWIGQVEAGVRCHLYDPVVERPASPAGAPAVAPRAESPSAISGTLLKVDGLKVYFPIQKGVLKRVVGHVRAVDGVSLNIDAGRTVALVGESGCGKTTVGKAILQLVRPTAGSVLFGDKALTALRGASLRAQRRNIQIIFQDPYASLNPRMLVGDIVEEGMRALHTERTASERQSRVEQLLAEVGLPANARSRYPHEFSGGQRQRISIARALAVEPKLLVCDEPTSALDVSVQAQIINLLKGLQGRHQLSYLFITHNISVVEYLAHEVAVMYLGRIVEHGQVDEVLGNPKHPYTVALLSAVPAIDAGGSREVIRLTGDLPSPSNPPPGCHFHTRCPHVMPICREVWPKTSAFSATHGASCHLYSREG